MRRQTRRGRARALSSTTSKPPRMRRPAVRPLAAYRCAVVAAFATRVVPDRAVLLLSLALLRRAAHASRHLLSILLKRCCWKCLFCTSVKMLSSSGATSMVFVEIMSTCCTPILSRTEASHLVVHLDGLLCLRIELYCMLSSWYSSSFTSILGGAMTRTSSTNRRRGASATAAVQRHAQRAAACEHCARKSFHRTN